MTGDGGFERNLVNQLNQSRKNNYEYRAYRRKQHRFSSQDIDVLIDSNNTRKYLGVECKSMKIKDRNDKLYFSQNFSTDKDGNHQVENITEFLKETGRNGVLALAYRRGRGKEIQRYALNWKYVIKLYSEDITGIPKDMVEQYGVRLDDNYRKIFSVHHV